MLDFDYSILLRLVIAMLLGGIIGFERGESNHEAGFRTHTILCLGAALVMIVSEGLNKQYGNGDIMRMGAQVISGVGFLGAGSIIIDGNKVRGITTAAGLWTTACIGLAVGCGYYVISIAAVVLMLFAMIGLRSLNRWLRPKPSSCKLKINLNDHFEIKEVIRRFADECVQIYDIKPEEDGEDITVILEMKLQDKNSLKKLIDDFSAFKYAEELKNKKV